MFLLNLPIGASVAIVLILSMSLSVGIYFCIYRLVGGAISAGTKSTAGMVVRASGVMYALVIGLMFTDVTSEYNKMVLELEMEAAALTRLHGALERHRDHEKFEDTRKQLVEYIRFVVDVQWPALRELKMATRDPAVTGRRSLDQVWKDLDSIEYKPGDLNLKELLDQAEDHKIQRMFDIKGEVLPVFWYIAFIGYFFTLVPMCLEPPSYRRCLLVAVYSGMVAMVLLGTFILTHPYSPAAGINPQVFQWLLEYNKA